MTTDRDPQEVTAVLSAGKALAIVEVMLQASGPLSAREIGERSEVNRTTAHRLLNTLRDNDLILFSMVHQTRRGVDRISQHVVFAASARFPDLSHEGWPSIDTDLAIHIWLNIANRGSFLIYAFDYFADCNGC